MMYCIFCHRNKGEQDFVIEHMDASFRYPMEWSYHIQVLEEETLQVFQGL